MAINLVDNFNVTVGKPLDDRGVVADLTARDAIPSGIRYLGMPVFVISEGKEYILKTALTNSDWVNNTGGSTIRPSVTIAADNVDWALGDFFFKSISASLVMTFSNTQDGQAITVFIKNASGTNRSVQMPAGVLKDPSFPVSVLNGTTNVYSFVSAGGFIHAAYLYKLS